MKKLRLLIFMSLMTCCLMLMYACGGARLATPSNLTIDQDTLALTWNKVQDADGYIIKIDEEEIESRKNSHPLDTLAPGRYTISVKARGDGEEFRDSQWSESLVFDREEEQPLNYRPTLDNTGYEVAGIGTAEGAITIDKVYRGKPVVAIAEAAFANSVKITSIEIPNTIKSIGRRAFYNCIYLESVEIPKTVTSIGEYAFQSCSRLTEVEIPEAITVFNQYVFSYCSSLKSVKMGSKVTTIGDYAFSDCRSLEKIEMPDTVTSIGKYSFANCAAATTIDISSNVETIADFAFYKCESVTALELPTTLKSIGKNSFASCKKLEEITIPDSITELPDYAFLECSALGTVNLPDTITSIGAYVFGSTKIWNDSTGLVYAGDWIVGVKEEMKTLDGNGGIFVFDEGTVGVSAEAFYEAEFSTLVLPNSFKYVGAKAFYGCPVITVCFGDEYIQEGEGVVTIGTRAFAYCKQLKTVLIYGNNLTNIYSYAFVGCTELEEIDLPDGENSKLQQIGTYAFNNTGMWNNATTLVYADKWVVGCVDSTVVAESVRPGTEGIADYGFYNCPNLQAVSLPDSLKYIGEAAFYKCNALQSIEIPQNIQILNNYTFFNCYSLANVKFATGSELLAIGRSAFYGCELLESITLPTKVVVLGDYAFYNCINLSSVAMNGQLKVIGKRAFQMSFVQNIVIPNSVESLGSHAFYRCASLKTITLGTGITEILEFTFSDCTSLIQIVIPDNVTYIGKNAFKKCTSLTNLTLGNGLTKLDDYAFYGCNLKRVHIPENITTLGNYVFRNNVELTSIILPATLQNMGKHNLYGCTKLTIYCEKTSALTTWDSTWNSSFRPVVYGVTLSSDKSFVVSFTKGSSMMENTGAINGISAPIRVGYTFGGWATEMGGEALYTAENVHTAPSGTTLYAIWNNA